MVVAQVSFTTAVLLVTSMVIIISCAGFDKFLLGVKSVGNPPVGSRGKALPGLTLRDFVCQTRPVYMHMSAVYVGLLGSR